MNTLKRNKRTLYLCQKKEENGRVIFGEPIEMKVNFQPIEDSKTEYEILEVGPDHISTLIVCIKPTLRHLFHNGDRCYVFAEPPEEYDKACITADYFINGEPKLYMNECTFHLLRMSGD
jgi:hypothetical protein